jgi:hypothetical protein
MIVYVLLAILLVFLFWSNREGMETASALESSQKTAGVIKTLHAQLKSVAALQSQVQQLEESINDTAEDIGLYKENSHETDPTKIEGGYTEVI